MCCELKISKERTVHGERAWADRNAVGLRRSPVEAKSYCRPEAPGLPLLATCAVGSISPENPEPS